MARLPSLPPALSLRASESKTAASPSPAEHLHALFLFPSLPPQPLSLTLPSPSPTPPSSTTDYTLEQLCFVLPSPIFLLSTFSCISSPCKWLSPLTQVYKGHKKPLFPEDNLCGTFLQHYLKFCLAAFFCVCVCVCVCGGWTEYCCWFAQERLAPSPAWPCSRQEYSFLGTPLLSPALPCLIHSMVGL